MGILSWFSRGEKGEGNEESKSRTAPETESVQIFDMNGAIEVRRGEIPVAEVSVFEFGSVAASGDKVTLAGYCPVSEEIEPCRWEILPAKDSEAPQFRVVF